jgi:Concanavalin A-like lectin/glucanases superfamily/BNR repeat-like domain
MKKATITITFLAMLLTLALGHAQTSSIRHWTLDQPKSEGWLIHGEAAGVAGAKGGALKLDGHSIIELKDSAKLRSSAEDFTFTVWCNPLLLNGAQRMIAAKNRYSQNEREWGVMVDEDGKFRLYVQQRGWKKVEARTQPKAGHWHHIGVVLRGKTAELWVNGALEGQAALKDALATTAAPITLGGVLDGTPRQTFSGALDEAKFEPRALSPAEMAALYQPVTATLPVPEPVLPVTLWDEKLPVPKAADIPVLKGVRFSVIKPYEFKKDGYRFLHGVGLGFHKGKLYASFGHNKGGENTDTEEARFCVSEDDGRTWSAVRTMDDGGPDFAVSHGVFLSHKGTLWAFMGSYTGTMVGIHTRAYRLNETTGEFEKLGVIVKGGFWPMQEPIRMDDGNWIMSGITAGGDAPAGGKNPAAVAISHGDDLLKWDLVPISQVAGLGKVWGESAVIVEGKRITNVSRYGAEARALIATSDDYGRTWTAMRPTNLPMATSKPYAGVLSTGQRYLVCSTSADGGARRSPLTIALAKPGETQFSKVFVIRHALFPQGPGESHERTSLSYPYAIEHEGKLYVGYSNNGGNVGRIGEGRELWNNNSAELAVIPVSTLQ